MEYKLLKNIYIVYMSGCRLSSAIREARIADDSLQPDIHTLYIYFNNLYSMFIESPETVYGSDISQYYY